MRFRLALLVFSAVAVLVCAGCGSGLGTIRGVIGPCLGATGQAASGEYFKAEVWNGASEVRVFTVRYPWDFQVAMAPGVYTVTAGNSNLPATVAVREGQTVQAMLGSDCG
jgi:hypothetical protein